MSGARGVRIAMAILQASHPPLEAVLSLELTRVAPERHPQIREA